VHCKNTLVLKFLTKLVIVSLVACSKIPTANTPSPFVSLTSTHLPTSTLATPTKIHTPVPTPSTIPAPTLSTEEKENLINQLLTQDYHCKLPCWGDIEPGVTRWLDAKVFLEKFSQIYSSHPETYTAEFQYQGENATLAFYTHKDVVEFMGASRFEYPVYRLLQDYGKPDEVYFYILDVLPIDTDNPYTVYLFYKEKGIIAAYYDGASPKGAKISVCFIDGQGRKNHNAFLWLWTKGADKTFYNVTAEYMNKFSDHVSLKYYKLEELSSYNTNDFFEIYKLKDNENRCLQIDNPNPKPG